MVEYISSFTTGFGEIVKSSLPELLPGVRILRVYDGLIQYQYSGDMRRIRQILFFNNTFQVIRMFKNGGSFPQMIHQMASYRHRYMVDKGTYRVRYVKGNQFAKVDKQMMLKAEEIVKQNSHMRLDRLHPANEIWYMLRTEGIGFYLQLIHRRVTTEKDLSQGELRPEFAYLMTRCVPIRPQDVVCDPFCGYGAIPRQIVKHYRFQRMLVSDLEPGQIKHLSDSALGNHRKVSLFCSDARHLVDIADHSVNVVITDPPWGYYEKIENIPAFYREMLVELRRILTKNGRAVILTARKTEMEQAVTETRGRIENVIHTLVNGKKAAVYICRFAYEKESQ